MIHHLNRSPARETTTVSFSLSSHQQTNKIPPSFYPSSSPSTTKSSTQLPTTSTGPSSALFRQKPRQPFSLFAANSPYHNITSTNFHNRPKKRVKLQCLVLGAAGAGKTSILRRYFYRTFEDGSQVATLGSDFYIGHSVIDTETDNNHNNHDDDSNKNASSNDEKPKDNNNNNNNISVGGTAATATTTTTTTCETSQQNKITDKTVDEIIMMGKENVAHHRANSNNCDTRVAVNLQMWDTPGRERFYLKRKRRVTASLSDSFFRHADAVMLVYDVTSSTSFTQLLRWYADLMKIKKTTTNEFPILIVGNKLDIFKAGQQRATRILHPRIVPQRDVMGLGGRFKGKDFRYEYRVTPVNNNSNNQHSHTHRTTYFLATGENWTTDNSYLDSLLNSEDVSHPDREMVLLWCMRNGLQHLEVSAATGEGVDEALQTLLRLALKTKDTASFQDTAVPEHTRYLRRPKLDFHEMYAPKPDDVEKSDGERCLFFLPPIKQLFK